MSYKESLASRFHDAKEKMDAATDVERLEEIYKETMEAYKECIPAFFSGNGEGNRIRLLYEGLETYKFHPFAQETMVESVDLNISGDAFKDYLGGMCAFIEEACETSMDATAFETKASAIQEKLDRARANDALFIESIFGGSENKSQPETIMESVKNIEYLIDFMDVLKEECSQCMDTMTHVKTGIGNQKASEPLLLEAARLMTESMNNYVFHTISNVFESYDTFHEVLEYRGRKPAPEKVPYKIF